MYKKKLHWQVCFDRKKYEFVREMIKLGADINTKNKNGNCALHIAVINNDLDTIKELVKLEADINTKEKDNEPVSQYNNDALSIAIEQFDVPMVEELLNLGAKIRNYHLKIAKQPIVNILLEKLYKAQ